VREYLNFRLRRRRWWRRLFLHFRFDLFFGLSIPHHTAHSVDKSIPKTFNIRLIDLID
jgi:hypothetical protein